MTHIGTTPLNDHTLSLIIVVEPERCTDGGWTCDDEVYTVPSSIRSHKRPDRVASLLKVVPLPMLNESDAQTEDGHAMTKSDTFHL